MCIGLTNWIILLANIPANASGIEMGIVPQDRTPFGAMRLRFMSPIGVFCQKPPYRTMTVIDLKSKQIVWQKPLGILMDTGIFNIPIHIPIPIGGVMTTKSVLLFLPQRKIFTYAHSIVKQVVKFGKLACQLVAKLTPITYISLKQVNNTLLSLLVVQGNHLKEVIM